MAALLGVGLEALLADQGVIDQVEEELVLLVLCLDFLAEIIEEAVKRSGRRRHGEDPSPDLRKTNRCQTTESERGRRWNNHLEQRERERPPELRRDEADLIEERGSWSISSTRIRVLRAAERDGGQTKWYDVWKSSLAPTFGRPMQVFTIPGPAIDCTLN